MALSIETGTVRSFNDHPDRNYGFLEVHVGAGVDTEQVFFHFDHRADMKNPRIPKQGDILTFRRELTKKKPKAVGWRFANDDATVTEFGQVKFFLTDARVWGIIDAETGIEVFFHLAAGRIAEYTSEGSLVFTGRPERTHPKPGDRIAFVLGEGPRGARAQIWAFHARGSAK